MARTLTLRLDHDEAAAIAALMEAAGHRTATGALIAAARDWPSLRDAVEAATHRAAQLERIIRELDDANARYEAAAEERAAAHRAIRAALDTSGRQWRCSRADDANWPPAYVNATDPERARQTAAAAWRCRPELVQVEDELAL